MEGMERHSSCMSLEGARLDMFFAPEGRERPVALGVAGVPVCRAGPWLSNFYDAWTDQATDTAA